MNYSFIGGGKWVLRGYCSDIPSQYLVFYYKKSLLSTYALARNLWIEVRVGARLTGWNTSTSAANHQLPSHRNASHWLLLSAWPSSRGQRIQNLMLTTSTREALLTAPPSWPAIPKQRSRRASVRTSTHQPPMALTALETGYRRRS
jgi:hypothetical protein